MLKVVLFCLGILVSLAQPGYSAIVLSVAQLNPGPITVGNTVDFTVSIRSNSGNINTLAMLGFTVSVGAGGGRFVSGTGLYTPGSIPSTDHLLRAPCRLTLSDTFTRRVLGSQFLELYLLQLQVFVWTPRTRQSATTRSRSQLRMPRTLASALWALSPRPLSTTVSRPYQNQVPCCLCQLALPFWDVDC